MARNNVEILWRVWVTPGANSWTLANGPAMKDNRQARRVTLDGQRYARLVDGRLGLDEPLADADGDVVLADAA